VLIQELQVMRRAEVVFCFCALVLHFKIRRNSVVEHVHVEIDARSKLVMVSNVARIALTADLEVAALRIVAFN
jgi:hypothetical protein